MVQRDVGEGGVSIPTRAHLSNFNETFWAVMLGLGEPSCINFFFNSSFPFFFFFLQKDSLKTKKCKLLKNTPRDPETCFHLRRFPRIALANEIL